MRSTPISVELAATSARPVDYADIPVASLRARIGGYVVDMVIFAAIAMIMLVVAGLVLLLATDFAEQDPGDADTYMFLALFGAGTPFVWTLLNLILLATRRQTGGQYVAGLRLAREDGAPISFPNVLGWWFCFNPLLTSWPLAIVAGLPLAAIIAIVLGSWTVAAFTLLMVVCVVSPIIALISAAIDSRNRALHDRIIGTIVVPA